MSDTRNSTGQVDVLMATYNGGAFIDLQIASILSQTHAPIRLLVRDDGSIDGTANRLAVWAVRDSRITLIDDARGRLGPAGNFLTLLRSSTAEYVMFADQDDVWLSSKVERSIQVLRQDEGDLAMPRGQTPALLVCDAISFEEGRGFIAATTQRARPTRMEDFLFLNGGFYGCCMVLNRALVERVIASKVDYCAQHDHLVSLVALAFGRVLHLDERLMFYRRHAANVSGGPVSSALKVRQFLYSRKPIVVDSMWRAVDSFLRAEEGALTERDRRTIECFLRFPSQSRWVNAWMISTYPFRIYGTRLILLVKLVSRPLIGA